MLPLEAVALAFVSLAATFDTLTWIFSDGHGAAALGVIALILDATLVRMLLVPALVRLMGPANWWKPRIPARDRTPTLAAHR